MQKEKGISTLMGIIIIIVVAVILFGAVFAYQYFSAQKADNQSQVQNQQQQILNRDFPLAGEPTDQTADWKTFDSGDGFEFKYPELKSFITLLQPGPGIIRDDIGMRGEGNVVINGNGCYVGGRNTGFPNPILEKEKKLINNINFCLSETGECAMGYCYPTFFYTTTYSNGNYFTIVLPFSTRSCQKENSDYEVCKDFFNDPFNNPSAIADRIISTFKFTK